MAHGKGKSRRHKVRRKVQVDNVTPIAAHASRCKLFTYAMAAPFLGVSQGTLENWVSSGLYKIPFVKVGRLVRFKPASLERWLESREHNTGQPTVTAAADVEHGSTTAVVEAR